MAPFEAQLGASLVRAMTEFASLNIPDGFEAEDMTLTFTFNSPLIPVHLHGTWQVSIRKDQQ